MPDAQRFNAFNGVFVPTFLSIVGVILFLRLGQIVGSTGMLGTMIIILLAVSVVIATGLSLSTITTNIQIGKGGAYSIISKTLGLEVGGSVGIPLYLAHVFSVALYLFGFAEAWGFVFPSHPDRLVILAAFAVLFALIAVSTRIAVKTQVAVFTLVCVSFLSIFVGGSLIAETSITSEITRLVSSNFWSNFALFFPATTGLMAGIALSGELKDPKHDIPRGLLWAIGVTTLIYMFMTIWLGNTASYQVLKDNTLIIIEEAWSSWLVLLGVLAATFSSALTTAVAAPRLLEAMADNRVIPFGEWLAQREGDVPFNATVITSALLVALLVAGSLDAVAPILTVFFLLTYAMINLVVFLEQSLGSVSFRPTMSIPQFVPFFGAASSTIIIFLINPVVGFISLILLAVTYNALLHKELKETDGDVRSGIFRNVAEWASRRIVNLPESMKHTWKPNILLPVQSAKTLLGNFPLIHAIASPNGTMDVLGLDIDDKASLDELPRLVHKFGDEDMFTSTTTVEADTYADGLCISLEAMAGQVFHPNIVFLTDEPGLGDEDMNRVFETTASCDVGIVYVERDAELGLGTEDDIHVWINEDDVSDALSDDRSYDLAMLLAYRLQQNWDGTLHVHMAANTTPVSTAERYLETMLYEGRFPYSTAPHVHDADEQTALASAPHGDIHLIPVEDAAQFHEHKDNVQVDGKTYAYIRDSGKEDILG
jgi:amino acid transporter